MPRNSKLGDASRSNLVWLAYLRKYGMAVIAWTRLQFSVNSYRCTRKILRGTCKLGRQEQTMTGHAPTQDSIDE